MISVWGLPQATERLRYHLTAFSLCVWVSTGASKLIVCWRRGLFQHEPVMSHILEKWVVAAAITWLSTQPQGE